MNYVIAVSTSDGKQFRWTITAQFSGSTWNRLWTELGVVHARWEEWQAARGNLVVMPQLPILSRLAHIEAGTISFEPVALERECRRALAVAVDSDVRAMLESFQRSAISAVERSAVVDVYPSCGESVGDQLSSEFIGE